MKPTATMQIKATDNISLSKPHANFPTNARARKAQLAEKENELPDDFIVGALLFSLLESNQSELISEMLPSYG